jgi:hypothetical protein
LLKKLDARLRGHDLKNFSAPQILTSKFSQSLPQGDNVSHRFVLFVYPARHRPPEAGSGEVGGFVIFSVENH